MVFSRHGRGLGSGGRGAHRGRTAACGGEGPGPRGTRGRAPAALVVLTPQATLPPPPPSLIKTTAPQRWVRSWRSSENRPLRVCVCLALDLQYAWNFGQAPTHPLPTLATTSTAASLTISRRIPNTAQHFIPQRRAVRSFGARAWEQSET